tara:strand:- start:190 stop:453 length:264 start_codon:yes stop_codon:yes gene_type:complete
MEIIIYSQDGCFYCDQMRQLCDRAEVKYKEIKVVEHATEGLLKKDFIKEHPDCTGFPWVIIDNETIGGLVESAKYFLKKGMVSAKRK